MYPLIQLQFTTKTGKIITVSTEHPFPLEYWPEVKDDKKVQQYLFQIALEAFCDRLPPSHQYYKFIDNLPDCRARQFLHNTRWASDQSRRLQTREQ